MAFSEKRDANAEGRAWHAVPLRLRGCLGAIAGLRSRSAGCRDENCVEGTLVDVRGLEPLTSSLRTAEKPYTPSCFCLIPIDIHYK